MIYDTRLVKLSYILRWRFLSNRLVFGISGVSVCVFFAIV